MKIAILGTGVNAAYTYKAVRDLDFKRIDLYGQSPLPRCNQYLLTWVPPTMEVEPASLLIMYMGDKRNYLMRKWGRYDETWCRWNSTGDVLPIYDPQEVIPQLWQYQKDGYSLIDYPQPLTDEDVCVLAQKYDVVFQTFPTQRSQEEQSTTWTIPFRLFQSEAWNNPEIAWLRLSPREEPFSILNGKDDLGDWTRLTFTWDQCVAEYPRGYELPSEEKGIINGTWQELYPLAKPWHQTPAPNVVLVGKLATWDPMYKLDQVYSKVQYVLNNGGWL